MWRRVNAEREEGPVCGDARYGWMGEPHDARSTCAQRSASADEKSRDGWLVTRPGVLSSNCARRTEILKNKAEDKAE